MLISEIQINEYYLLGCDRNTHGEGVPCYIRNNISYNVKSYFLKDKENMFFQLLLPSTKPVVVGTIYRPRNQTNFKDIFNKNLSKVDTNNAQILGDFNINLWQNGKYVFQKQNLLSCQSVLDNDKTTLISAKCLAESS